MERWVEGDDSAAEKDEREVTSKKNGEGENTATTHWLEEEVR